MARKPVIQLTLADSDLRSALADYARENRELATRLLDQVEHAYARIGEHPGIGSLRYAEQLEMPGLRCWPCRHFPWLIFYLEATDHIRVLRILHVRRDIPTSMQP